MKTIVTFIDQLTDLLVTAYGPELHEQVLRACQSAMNDPQTVTAREGTIKVNRGAVKGGITYKADGSLGVKDMAWNETESRPTIYTAKQTAPIEFVKFNDALANLYKKCGEPSGKLTLDTLPKYLRQWVDMMKQRADEKKSGTVKLGNGVSGTPKAPKAPKAPKREIKPAKSEQNGHAESAPVPA